MQSMIFQCLNQGDEEHRHAVQDLPYLCTESMSEKPEGRDSTLNYNCGCVNLTFGISNFCSFGVFNYKSGGLLPASQNG